VTQAAGQPLGRLPQGSPKGETSGSERINLYSSGMYVRLAFAVAAHLEPEILIVYEVLAVGDAEFQKKCLGKIRFEIKNQSEILKIMSYEELKKEVVALSFKEQKELSALLFSLWRKNNSEESLILERRVQDRDERNWVSLEDFSIQTQGQGA
jgi:hypothetical protein